jgi:hypothetical protein
VPQKTRSIFYDLTKFIKQVQELTLFLRYRLALFKTMISVHKILKDEDCRFFASLVIITAVICTDT